MIRFFTLYATLVSVTTSVLLIEGLTLVAAFTTALLMAGIKTAAVKVHDKVWSLKGRETCKQ